MEQIHSAAMKSKIFLSFDETAQSANLIAGELGALPRDSVWKPWIDCEIHMDEGWHDRLNDAVEMERCNRLYVAALLGMFESSRRARFDREWRQIFPNRDKSADIDDSCNHQRYLAGISVWVGNCACEDARGMRADEVWASQPDEPEGDDMELMLLTQSSKKQEPKLPPPAKPTKNKRKKNADALQENPQTGADLSPRKTTDSPPSSKPKPGKAAIALKRMREEVKFKIPKAPLTLKRMAEECKILGGDDKPSPSSYQYIEESVRDKFDMDRVNQIKGPLIKRGIPMERIVRELVGEKVSLPMTVIVL